MAVTVNQTIKEVDVVAFTEPIDKDEALTREPGEPRGIGQWPAGTEGTVVSDLDDRYKLIEISDQNGVALDFVTVPVQKLKLIAKHSR